MKITLTWEKNYNIRTSISAFYHQFFFSFDLSLSCKLQLIDLIMVSAACLAGWQTILECFFPRTVGSQEKKRDKGMES